MLNRDKATTAYGQYTQVVWSVTGPSGKMVFELIGRRLAVEPVDGEVDCLVSRHCKAIEALWYSTGDDEVIWQAHTDWYAQLLGAEPALT